MTKAKFEAGKTYFTTWNEDTGRPHTKRYTIEKRTAKTIVIHGYRFKIFTTEDGIEGAKVSYATYIYADKVYGEEAIKAQVENDKAWDKMDADICRRAEELKAAEADREEILSTPLVSVEAQDEAVKGEYANCARASMLAFAAMAPAFNAELKKIIDAEPKRHNEQTNINPVTKSEIEMADNAKANETLEIKSKKKSAMTIVIDREEEQMTITVAPVVIKGRVNKYFIDGFDRDGEGSKYTKVTAEIVIQSYILRDAIGCGATIFIDERLASEFKAIAETPYKGEFKLVYMDKDGRPVKVGTEAQDMFAEKVDMTPYHVEIKMFGENTPMFEILKNGQPIISKNGSRTFRKGEADAWIIKAYQMRKQYPNMTIEIPRVVAGWLDSLCCNSRRILSELNITLTEETSEVDPADYAISPEAQDVATQAEIEMAENAKARAKKAASGYQTVILVVETRFAANGSVQCYVKGKKWSIKEVAEEILYRVCARGNSNVTVIAPDGMTYTFDAWEMKFVYRNGASAKIAERIKDVVKTAKSNKPHQYVTNEADPSEYAIREEAMTVAVEAEIKSATLAAQVSTSTNKPVSENSEVEDTENAIRTAADKIIAELNNLEPDPNADNYTAARYLAKVCFTPAGQNGELPWETIGIRSTDFARAERAMNIIREGLSSLPIEFVDEPQIELMPTYYDGYDGEDRRVYHVDETDGSEEDADEETFTAIIPADDADDPDGELIDSPEETVAPEKPIDGIEITSKHDKVQGVRVFKVGNELVYLQGVRAFKVGNELVYARKYKWRIVNGELNARIIKSTVDEIKFNVSLCSVTEKEFWRMMIECGACIVDELRKPTVEEVKIGDDINVGEPTPGKPADDFMSKLTELKAEADAANAEDRKARDAEVEAYNAWQAAKQKVEETADKYHVAINAFKTLGCQKAKELRDTLLENDIKLFSNAKIKIINQKGEEIARPDLSQIFITFYDSKFRVTASWDKFAEYDTPEQVKDVIERLKAAIARGDDKFSFPTDDEPINQPKEPDNSTPEKLRDSIARGMKECLIKVQEHCAENNLTEAQAEMERYQICSQALHESCAGGASQLDLKDDIKEKEPRPITA